MELNIGFRLGQTNMKFNIEFTVDEIQIIDKALSELPFRIAAPLIALINTQIQMQLKKNESEK